MANPDKVVERLGKLEGRISGGEGELKGRGAVSSDLSGGMKLYLAGLTLVVGFCAVTLFKTGERLTAIEQWLQPQKLLQISQNATNPKNVAEADQIIGDAISRKIYLPKQTVTDAGKQFVQNAGDSKEAWNVAVRLVNFSTTLNSSQVPDYGALGIAPFTPGYKFSVSDSGPSGLELGGKIFSVFPYGKATDEASARLEMLSAPNKVDSGVRYIVVQSFTYNGFGLDGLWMKHVVIRDATLDYNGGPVQMEDVYFENCVFRMPRKQHTIEFADKLLSAPSVDYTVGNTPTSAGD